MSDRNIVAIGQPRRAAAIIGLQESLDRKLEGEVDRIKAEIAAKLEAADDVGAAAYEVSTAIYNARIEINLDLHQELGPPPPPSAA